ncbi:MAG: hypothetical protein ACK4YF_09410 [Exilispira sp.]
MKQIIKIIMFIILLFLQYNIIYAQTNDCIIYFGIGNSFGYTISPNIYDYMWFNIDFGTLFNIYEEDYYYYYPLDFYIGFILNKKHFYLSGEIEIANFFHFKI